MKRSLSCPAYYSYRTFHFSGSIHFQNDAVHRRWNFSNFPYLCVCTCWHICASVRRKKREKKSEREETGKLDAGGVGCDGHVKHSGTIVHRARSSNLWINISWRHPVENYSRKCPYPSTVFFPLYFSFFSFVHYFHFLFSLSSLVLFKSKISPLLEWFKDR